MVRARLAASPGPRPSCIPPSRAWSLCGTSWTEQIHWSPTLAQSLVPLRYTCLVWTTMIRQPDPYSTELNAKPAVSQSAIPPEYYTVVGWREKDTRRTREFSRSGEGQGTTRPEDVLCKNDKPPGRLCRLCAQCAQSIRRRRNARHRACSLRCYDTKFGTCARARVQRRGRGPTITCTRLIAPRRSLSPDTHTKKSVTWTTARL